MYSASLARRTIVLAVLTLLAACGTQASRVSEAPPTQAPAQGSSTVTAPPAQTAVPASTSIPTPATPQQPPVLSYRVIKSYPHDPAAFTQGLVIDNGVLYEGTGIEGQSTLRKVNLETGEVLQQQKLPDEVFGEGITVIDDRIIQLTWLSNVGYVYARDTFARLQEWSYSTEGWGITDDGAELIMSDGTPILRFLDPRTFAELRQIEVKDVTGPVANLNELEYIDGSVYANIWQTDRIAKIDPKTGQVVAWIDLAGLLSEADRAQPVDVLNGIAYDERQKRLFVTGKLWPKLFEIELITP